jgi:hypothetical protein
MAMARVPQRQSRNTSELASLSSSPGTVQIWVGAHRHRRLGRRLGSLLLVSLGLGSGTFLLVLSWRLGTLLMLNPEALPQVQHWFRPAPPTTTLTLEELRQTWVEPGQTLGEGLSIRGSEGDVHQLLLLPILSAADQQIAALVLLERQPPDASNPLGPDSFQILSTAPLPAWDSETVLAPLAATLPPGQPLPKVFAPTRLTRLPSPPLANELTWLSLEGQWQTPGINLRYGQLLYVDASQKRLELLTVWSSPANRLPQWADLDGLEPSDLVIDETLGLEPRWQGLQILPAATGEPRLQVRPVSWTQVPLDAGDQNLAYQQALRLARNGLWRAAHDHLTSLKATLAEQWNPAAEAQLQTAARHAAITSHQAEQDWAMPTQHLIALLIDSRWDEALVKLEDQPTLLEPLLRRLAADQGYLWNRIVTTTALPKPDPAVFVWGGLILKAQQNDSAAASWLDRQPIPPRERQRLVAVLTAPVLNSTIATKAATDAALETSTSPALTGTESSSSTVIPIDGVMGTVSPLNQLEVDRWYIPADQPTDASMGQWYSVEVQWLSQGGQWRGGSPQPLASPQDLWQALAHRGQPTLMVKAGLPLQPSVPTPLWIRGVAIANGNIRLLATGMAVEPATLPGLAFSPDVLIWLEAAQRQRFDSTPVIARLTKMIFPSQAVPSQSLTAALASLQLHRLDLTGDGQPEQVFTLDHTSIHQLQSLGANLDGLAPKTLIVNPDDQLLYSDLTSPQQLVAFTHPSQGNPPSLLVYREGNYVLLPWSAKSQRFE